MPQDAPLLVKVLNLLNGIREFAPFDRLSAHEDELLRSLIVYWHSNGELTVSEIMKTFGSKSQSTTYRRVMALRDKGMINLRVDKSDRRVKFVEPTALAHDYVQHIDGALTSLLTQPAQG